MNGIGPFSGVRKYGHMYRQLIKLNMRKSIVVWFVPALVLIAWYAGRERYELGVTLWTVRSTAIGFSAVMLGPVVAGLAAWFAVQPKRQGFRDLIVSLPMSDLLHNVSVLVSVLFWVIVAYLLNAVLQAGWAFVHADWGHLDIAPVLLGLCLIVACVCFGYAVGAWFPLVGTPLVVTFVVLLWFFGTLGFVRDSSWQYLSPTIYLNPDEVGVLARYWPEIGPPFTIWSLGLAGLCVGFLLLRAGSRPSALSFIALMIAVSSVGASMLVRLPADFEAVEREQIAYTPVCERGETIDVCVHPAFVDILDATVAVADAVFEPVVGLPGVPTRINQFPSEAGMAKEPLLPIYIEANGRETLAVEYALAIVEGRPFTASYAGPTEAQAVIGRWLIARAGALNPATEGAFMPWMAGDGSLEAFQQLNERINQAVERFNRLTPGQQRSWLESNWSELRSGVLSLDAFP
jgi:hypothetical protein